MKKVKQGLKKYLLKRGYLVSKISEHSLQNLNSFSACKSQIKETTPVIFDIGMNHGQTLNKIKDIFPDSIIHGFEASKYCYNQLEKDFGKEPNIMLNNMGVAEKEGELKFNEYSWDAINSFLNRAYGKASLKETYNVKVISIDSYCGKNKVDKIHILKSDAEGFELKILKGAKSMLMQNKIQFIFLELLFDKNFIGQPSVGEILSYLESLGFSLVRFYDFTITENGLASKTDALFINKSFNE
ncbi:FkbM family methyltransferase [Seonamhaeicola sp. ML3]|uniref:FkbM family methyltransferase n=1 Tax=Seonamhaeicola sp. ML3 TaxID=2937786 RepID=UPI00200EE50C|nr:FkbM family methyltransferase [Seonamhaeicola sp. ML3]